MEHKIINISEIDKNRIYEGYLWLSDSKEPVVLDNAEKKLCDVLKEKEKEGILNDSVNPFVIESFLWDKANKDSYSIKYVDGKSVVHKFHITEDDLRNNETKEYFANRIEGQLLFLDVWSPEKDQQCLDMEVLQPEAKVFIGFKK